MKPMLASLPNVEAPRHLVSTSPPSLPNVELGRHLVSTEVAPLSSTLVAGRPSLPNGTRASLLVSTLLMSFMTTSLFPEAGSGTCTTKRDVERNCVLLSFFFLAGVVLARGAGRSFLVREFAGKHSAIRLS